MFSAKAETFLANTSDLEHTTKSQKAMHHEEIELNFVMSTNSRFGVRNLVGSSQYAYFSWPASNFRPPSNFILLSDFPSELLDD
jgi:hypothetical protein